MKNDLQHIKISSIKLLALLILFNLYSCKKFVEIDAPETQIEKRKIFMNDQAAVSAAIGLYYRMVFNNLLISNGAVTLYTGLSSDEIHNTSPDSELDQFKDNSLLPNVSGINSGLWKPAYQNIYHANSVLEGLTNSTTLTQSIKNQLKGEMLVGRALHYFYLANLFGDVPLVVTTDYEINAVMPRNPVSQIYEQITNDLIEAASLLPTQYPTTERARPNKWTAAALLARVYLYQKNWSKAEEQAGQIINSGDYSLQIDLNSTFLSSSNETIWQLKPVSTYMNTSEGLEFNPFDPSLIPKYSITNSLLNQFDSSDRRKANWLATNTASGQLLYYPYKYKVGFSSTLSEYYIVFRLAELYLIRAEARVQQNNIIGAQSDLNIIRNRAGLPNTSAGNQSDLLKAVENENRIEFFVEWGHRWFDLKRTNKADIILGIEKAPNWQTTDALYPIPLTQIQANPHLTQNAGY